MNNGTCPDAAQDLPVFGDETRYVSLTLVVLATALFVGGIGWWIVRRNDPLLRKRSFGLMLCSTTGIALQLVSGPLRTYTGLREFSCDGLLFLSFLYLPVAVGPLVVRLIIFMNQARFERSLARGAADAEDGEEDEFDAQEYVQAGRLELTREFFLYTVMCGCVRGVGAVTDGADEEERGRRSRRDDGAAAAAAMRGDKKLAAASAMSVASEDMRLRNRQQQLRYFLKSGTYAALAQLLITLVAVASVLVIGLRADSPYFGQQCSGCLIGGSDEQWLLLMGVIIALVYATLVVRLRNAPDPLGILRELQLCLFGGAFVAAGMALVVIDVNNMYEDGQFNWLLIISVGGVITFFAQCPLQVYKSWRAEQRKKRTSLRRESRVTLDQVLAAPDMKRAFHRYLATEWSSENAIFLDVVSKYKGLYASSSKKTSAVRAVDIFMTFIRDRSMLEVNVSGEVRRQLRAALAPLQEALTGNPGGVVSEALVPKHDVFDRAYAEVYDLVETDSFPRFLSSPQFAEIDPKRGGAAAVPEV